MMILYRCEFVTINKIIFYVVILWTAFNFTQI